MDSAEFLLGTVTAVSQTNGIRIQLDGQDAAMSKYYKMLNTGADAPGTGDRVVVMKHSGTYIVMGRIGTPNQNSGKVDRSGDTMTGNLIVKNGNYVATDSSSQQVGVRPESNTATNNFHLRDKIQAVFGRIRGYFGTDGRVGIQLLTERTVDGTNTINQLGLYVDEAGERTVSVTSAQAWRKALGLGNTNGALPLTIAQGGTGSTGIAADSTIANIITAASGMSITSADYYAWGKIAMFHIGINVTTATTAGAWHDLGTLKEGKRPPCTTFVQELNKAIVAMYPNGRIVVWGEWPVGKAFELTATYLLP